MDYGGISALVRSDPEKYVEGKCSQWKDFEQYILLPTIPEGRIIRVINIHWLLDSWQWSGQRFKGLEEIKLRIGNKKFWETLNVTLFVSYVNAYRRHSLQKRFSTNRGTERPTLWISVSLFSEPPHVCSVGSWTKVECNGLNGRYQDLFLKPKKFTLFR